MSINKGVCPRHSQETKDKIFELKSQGILEKEIAKLVGVKFNYVRKLLSKSTIRLTKEQYNKNRKQARQKNIPDYKSGITEDILNFYYSGMKKADIAIKLNINLNKVISDIQLYAPRRLTKEEIDARRPRKYKNQICSRIARALRSRLRDGLKAQLVEKRCSTIKDLGMSLDEFIVYFEKLFQPGMNWGNWSYDGWHIDHILPLSSFNLEDPEEQKKAVHYTNLQPLWARDNQSKGAKIV
jgi:hypothetical protein